MTQRLHRRRGFLVGAACLLAASTALSGCGKGSSSTSSDSKKQNISFLTHYGPDQVKLLNAAAAAFHAQNPSITVTIRAVPFGNLLSTLRTQANSPSGPTIAGIYDLWLPELVKSGVAAKAPADVESDVKTNWPANLAGDVTKDGAVRGYPNEVDLYALNYNKKLFAAAGITKPPATWDELLADARKLPHGKGQQSFGVITSWAAGVVHPWLSMVNSDGGALLDSSGKPAITGPAAQATTQLYKTMVSEGLTKPSMSSANANTTGPYLDNFTNEKTAMLVMANWWQASLKQAMGPKFDDIATAPIPTGPDGQKSSSVSYSWLTMVNGKASAVNQQAAWKFLTWLNGTSSGKNGSSDMADILLSMGILPSRTSDIAAHKSELSTPFLQTYVDQLPNSTPFPTVLGGEQMTEAVQTEIEKVVFGKESPADALTKAQAAAASALQGAGG